MDRTLLLITSQFPFGTGETFLETEILFLQKEFEKILIIARNTDLKQTRNVPDNVTVFRYNPASSFLDFMFLPVILIGNLHLILALYRNETEFRDNSDNHLNFKRKSDLIRKIIKALQLRHFFSGVLKNCGIKRNVVFYSYWMNSGANAISLLDFPESVRIARAHGSDLYEEKSPSGFLPLLKSTAEKLDNIFFISEDGKNYFLKKTGIEEKKCIISRLGVNGEGNIIRGDEDKYIFRIVTCSNLIPLKRIDMVIQALAKINSAKNISWLHFGDGHLRGELEGMADKLLKPLERITYEFAGFVPNSHIFDYYRNHHVDLFINTSLTEGVPVSIMEAQSYGIPVMATDVGGVHELLSEDSGILLSPDISSEELARSIEKFIALPDEIKRSFSKRSFQNRMSNYNASVNYPAFLQKVNSIFAAKTASC